MDLEGMVQDLERGQKKQLLYDYFVVNMKHHNLWFYSYVFCEFLALVNIVGTVQF